MMNMIKYVVPPNYCNSTISSAAKKSMIKNYDDNRLNCPFTIKNKRESRNPGTIKTKSRPNKSLSMDRHTKYLESNLSDDSAYNDDFVFESVENNSRACSVETCHRRDLKKLTIGQGSPIKVIKNKKKFRQDHSYSRFLEEITNEIVRLDLSTDKALRAVFQKHIKYNTGILDKRKMTTEVKKLQELLGLPVDNEDIYSEVEDSNGVTTTKL
ncbi:uncharacterized protein LOC126844652 isoform X2 [Adelges cooleyi]|uniref:uncharacterized protein LOC126844652 isoform X2 n=1 Tax=Adelges cooleyi TaxID=133065 RepID=UPI0021802163|nr:uncharacterized protein LOC126844652 isoform X2 [Adelges cooleyi]